MKYRHYSVDQRNIGIYLLPNLFTSASMFSGFFSIIIAFNSNFVLAAICIYLAAIMDFLDGRIARLTNTQSSFGAEYDSMADIVSFGVAPALIIYFWSLKNLNKFGWAIAFIYLSCVALRLSRFNSHIDHDLTFNIRYFVGLPCPAAAAVLAGFVWFFSNLGYHSGTFLLNIVTAIMTLYLSAMMISNINFKSFKDYDLKGKVVFIKSVFIVFIITVIFIDPSMTLFTIFMFYSVSGFIKVIFYKIRSYFFTYNK